MSGKKLIKNFTMQNHIEHEAKILDIDKNKVIHRLERLGARKILDAVTVIETYDVNPAIKLKKKINNNTGFSPILEKVFALTKGGESLLDRSAYLRLRKEGKKSELILKYSENQKGTCIKSEREISIPVRNSKEWVQAQISLKRAGFVQKFYQEKHRISYIYDPLALRFDIDTWPNVPTYIEIEGERKSDINKGAKLLRFKTSNLRSDKAKDVFLKYSVSPVYMSFSKKTAEVSIAELLRIMIKVLRNKGLINSDARYVAEHYLTAELSGKTTHGIRKFCWDVGMYEHRVGKPKITRDNSATAIVDGNCEIGPLAARFCAELAIKKAKRSGIAIVGLKSFQRYGALGHITRDIASQGYVGVAFNSTEPFVIVPGSKSPILGTNPFSIAIPTNGDPAILDMSTTKLPMSLVWYARSNRQDLPTDTFLDENGKHTTDPWLAQYVEAWGGVKGFNFSFMLQLILGGLLDVRTQDTWNDPYAVGAIFLAINPDFLTSRKDFTRNVAEFIQFAKLQGASRPGNHGYKMYRANIKRKKIFLPEQTLGWLNLL